MDEFVFFYPQGHAAHYESGHPERPERVEAMRQALREAGWWDAYPCLEPLAMDHVFMQGIHTPDYLDVLERSCRRGAPLDMDTYTTPASWDLALKAAGGAAAVASAVWEGQARRGFALTRPPGHHATPSRGMGFCLLNNIALAAQYLLRPPEHSPSGGASAQRLAIVDLDLHHGNGTQEIFYARGDLLYISTHQSPHYPGSGRIEETGAGEGQGCTANIPFPPFTGDQGFSAAMQELILPSLQRFAPQMLLVSYGFDPHWRDPLGHMQLSAAGYGALIAELAAWADENCQGKIALFLEGGYDLEAGQACTQAVTAALLGQPFDDPLGPSPHPEGSSWQPVVRRAREIWGL
ncbi:MAG: histone deacetylase [Anaerolineales bacterium]|nr:histone deacetylase [Anaerolineales bacterium]